MKICQGDRIVITTGPLIGEFGEIGYYDQEEKMFVVSIEDRPIPYAMQASDFRPVPDWDGLIEYFERFQEDE